MNVGNEIEIVKSVPGKITFLFEGKQYVVNTDTEHFRDGSCKYYLLASSLKRGVDSARETELQLSDKERIIGKLVEVVSGPYGVVIVEW